MGRRHFLAAVGVTALAGCNAADSDPATTTTATTTPPTTTTTTTSSEEPPNQTTARPTFSGTWPGYGYDLANTGYNTESPRLNGDAQRWSTFVQGYRTLPAPAVSESGVYIGSEHRLFGLVRGNGEWAWEVTLDGYTHMYTPTVRDGVVYGVGRGLIGANAGSDNPGTVVAVDERTGATVWRQPAYVSGSPSVLNDLVVCPGSTAAQGFIEARSRSDGNQQWTYEFGDGSTSFGSPAYADGVVYATGTIEGASKVGRLVALDPTSGAERWRFDIEAAANGAPVVSAGAVIFADANGTVHSVDIQSGAERWSVSVGDGVFARPAVTPNRVFAISRGKLSAIDRSMGRAEWTAPIGSSHFSTVSVIDETVYVGGPTLYGYSVNDGASQLTREIPGYAGAYGGPVVVNGEMFVGACVKQDAGDLYNNFVYRLA